MLLPILLLPICGLADESQTEARFISNARQLIYEGKRSGEGYFHPDGNLLIFQSEREPENPFYQIYLLDLLSGESARVSPGQGKTTCGFFQPGGERVLFASTHHDPQAVAKQKAELEFRASGKQRRYAWDYDPAMDIFSAQQDGTQLARLTEAEGYDAEAAFSPDGKQIVFCSLRAGYAQASTPEVKQRLEKDPAYYGDIWIMNADGTNQRQLTTAAGYDGGPFFSPDGQRIVWRRFDESGMNADVFTMKTDGSDVRRLTEFKSMSWAPFYHPSGKYLIFTSNKLGFENFELFVVDAEGTKEPARVTFTNGFDGLPVFSPDGKRLCWTSGRTADGKSQLFMADWNDAAALTALAEAPARKVDGKKTATVEERVVALEKYLGDQPAQTLAAEVVGGTVVHLRVKPAITAEDLRNEVTSLAAPEFEGRATGSDGAQKTAEALAGYFQGVGLTAPGAAFFQSFQFDAGVKLVPDKNALIVTADGSRLNPLGLDQDFRPIPFSDSGSADAEVVFAGYGLNVPGEGATRYNSYEGLDVKDKIVLLLRYVPEAVEPARRAQLNRYAGLRYKAMMARERGAKAVLVVTGPNSPQAGELLPLTGDGALAGSGVLAASITSHVAEALLAPSGKKLKELQDVLDTENPHAEGGFVLPKVRVSLSLGLEHIKKQDRNVVAVLPPVGTDEYIVIGAHYDHLGRGGSSSMARAGEEGQVHPGADDNASGTALIMELAANFAAPSAHVPKTNAAAATAFRRGLIFAAWSGEESGLLGSAAFCANPPVPIEKITAYLNFDMVGRLRENKLTLQGVGSSKLWRRLIEKRNVAAGFNLTLQEDPYLPTDTTSFYPKRIPVLNFFTGAHEDYHRPTDTADKVDFAGLERIAKFAREIVFDLATRPDRPDFARVERSDQGGGSRETLRAYLGTIPDYTTEIKGVKLSGVRGGSPAEKGGLQGGDVLVQFGPQAIQNIYDYTYALDAVKIGQAIKVIVERGGQRV
ncbi:MAG TPA: M28 family peptidase, partial [Chthoniobacteraceae bacterium]|nr:M28 family peptidase [Chthoniobacteraceae bacterium]